MPQLHVSLLDAPAIEVGRKAVETDTRKATALLASRDDSIVLLTHWSPDKLRIAERPAHRCVGP